MLKLKNVSKFYYQNGMIATGFSRVNLELNMGEFVVITGESGSGKSTLLNVLSGLDSYEEGEMYINGEETSHYDEEDFEEYRRRYVGNIFQNFNLVNSYTVYQNIELALLLNGEDSKEIKARVLGLIEKVGLTKFKNTKCSKLSGGQKQRVAIARALAKDTPIIVADEPTGNLDSESASGIVELLREISKDKLVIIVTHNLEQVEKYATRLIKMYDGKIVEDRKLVEPTFDEKDVKTSYKDISFKNKIKIGFRNTFNIPVKFILTAIVFFFVSTAVASTYASLEKTTYDDSTYGYNYYFNDIRDTRLVIYKEDRSIITEDDFSEIRKLNNVAQIVKDDLTLDQTTYISDSEWSYYVYGYIKSIDEFTGTVDVGRMPENKNEVVLIAQEGDYYFNDIDDFMDRDYYSSTYLERTDRENLLDSKIIKIVGIKYKEEGDYSYENYIYASEDLISEIASEMLLNFETVTEEVGEYKEEMYQYSSFGRIVSCDKVPVGKCYVPKSLDDYQTNGNVIGKKLKITVENSYTNETYTYTVSQKLTKTNIKKLTGLKYTESAVEQIYVNPKDYDKMFNAGSYQSSVICSQQKKVDTLANDLTELGYKVLIMRDSLDNVAGDLLEVLSLLKTAAIILLLIALFFIAYFIIKIVLKSRNAYFTTLRTLGATRKVTVHLLDLELIFNAIFSYIAFLILLMYAKYFMLDSDYLQSMLTYLTPLNYVLVFVIIVFMALLVANRFSRKLFKDSVMSSYREEV